jgi:hypothetical protein
MSKISPLIAQYLQENKSVNIEGYGTFFVNENTGYIDPNEKNVPASPVQFEYNSAAKTDDAFVTFIIQKTGKIRPLAIADLDTFLSLGKQLLNISKPLVIDGVGTLNKATAGHYEFIPGNFEPPKINTDNDRDRRLRQAKETNREPAVSFENNYSGEKKSNKGVAKRILGALTVLILLGGIGFALYKFVFSKNGDSETTKSTSKNTELAAKEDTTKNKKDTTKKQNAVSLKPNVPDSLGRMDFKILVRTTDSIGAYKRADQFTNGTTKVDLTGYQTTIVEKDMAANNFKVIMQFKCTAADTAALRVKAKSGYGTDGQEALFVQ